MTTWEHNIPFYGKVTITCNSDWSGTARITWADPAADVPLYHKPGRLEAEVPGDLLLEIGRLSGREQMKDELISWVEGLD